MAVFSKKTTLVHNITYMAIMTAINVIFMVLDYFLPFLILLLILILPFASALVSYFCQKRYYLIYAAASIGLCLIFNPADTIFYIVPALCSGFLIGVMLDKKINPFWIILCSTLVEVGLTYAFIPLINFIFKTDLVTSFLKIFGLKDFLYKEELMHIFILFIALTQCSLANFVLLTEIKKIGVETETRVACFGPYIIGLALCLIIGLIFALTYTPPSLAFIALSFYFAVFLLIDIVTSRRVITYICLGVLLTAAFFLFVIFYSWIIKPLGFALFGLFPFAIAITSFVNNYLLKDKSNI